jgi:hypothetical protein
VTNEPLRVRQPSSDLDDVADDALAERADHGGMLDQDGVVGFVIAGSLTSAHDRPSFSRPAAPSTSLECLR